MAIFCNIGGIRGVDLDIHLRWRALKAINSFCKALHHSVCRGPGYTSWKGIYWGTLRQVSCAKIWLKLFHDGGRYHLETSLLICRANQWTGLYMITAAVMKINDLQQTSLEKVKVNTLTYIIEASKICWT